MFCALYAELAMTNAPLAKLAPEFATPYAELACKYMSVFAETYLVKSVLLPVTVFEVAKLPAEIAFVNNTFAVILPEATILVVPIYTVELPKVDEGIVPNVNFEALNAVTHDGSLYEPEVYTPFVTVPALPDMFVVQVFQL